MCCGTTTRALRVLGSQQADFVSLGSRAEEDSKYNVVDFAQLSDVQRLDAESVELHASVQIRTCHTFRSRARKGHFGRHNVLKVLVYQLKMDPQTLRYSRQDDNQASRRAPTTRGAGEECSSAKDSWCHALC